MNKGYPINEIQGINSDIEIKLNDLERNQKRIEGIVERQGNEMAQAINEIERKIKKSELNKKVNIK